MKLSDFFNPDEVREYLRQPFNLDGYTVATNGHCMLRTALQPQYADCPDVLKRPLQKMFKTLDRLSGSITKPLPEINWPNRKPCSACLGKGGTNAQICSECHGEKQLTFSSSQNTYTVTCKGCNGRGELDGLPLLLLCNECGGSGKSQHYELEPIWIEGIKLNPNYLAIIAKESLISVAGSEDGTKLYFITPLKGSGMIQGIT